MDPSGSAVQRRDLGRRGQRRTAPRQARRRGRHRRLLRRALQAQGHQRRRRRPGPRREARAQDQGREAAALDPLGPPGVPLGSHGGRHALLLRPAPAHLDHPVLHPPRPLREEGLRRNAHGEGVQQLRHQARRQHAGTSAHHDEPAHAHARLRLLSVELRPAGERPARHAGLHGPLRGEQPERSVAEVDALLRHRAGDVLPLRVEALPLDDGRAGAQPAPPRDGCRRAVGRPVALGL